jgi:GNAT superfamily N-acetyltransferase
VLIIVLSGSKDMNKEDLYSCKILFKGPLKNGMIITIRRACKKDREKLIKFYEKLSTECIYNRFMGIIRYFDPYVDKLLKERAIVIVAETSSGEIVGVAEAVFDEKGRAESGIAVLDKYQGHGIGSLLGKYILEEARNAGIKKMYAYIMSSNTRALSMALKHGAKIEKKYSGMTYIVFDLSERSSDDKN